MRPFAFALVAWMLAYGAASAATPHELYEQGNFDAAIAAGLAQKDAAGLALAAHAELAAEAMRAIPCLPCLHRAEMNAWRATQMSSPPADAYLYLAIALGQKGRLQGPVAALGHGYAKNAKIYLDEALSIDPQNAFALAALGAWNIEIVRNGGATLARMMLGANVPDGLANFDRAFALDPGDVALRYQYALTLSGYDLNGYRSRIEAALALAATGKPRGAYEAFAQSRARELLDVLKKNDLDKYDQLVRRDQGYAD